MEPGLGYAIAAAAALTAAGIAFFGRTRWPAVVVVVSLAASGALLAWGALAGLGGSAGEYALAVPATALLVPFHVRIVLGPLGRRP